MAVLLGFALSIPVLLLAGFALAPRTPTRDDLRSRRLRRSIRRWRVQRAAKSEVVALARDWESVGRGLDRVIGGRRQR